MLAGSLLTGSPSMLQNSGLKLLAFLSNRMQGCLRFPGPISPAPCFYLSLNSLPDRCATWDAWQAAFCSRVFTGGVKTSPRAAESTCAIRVWPASVN